ncbi:hypothetical protein OUI_0056 [Helicobacter pylori R036d]|uniref:Uncharacterized protein n=1 Tax=Helicobacter pylori R036d TaxID=1145113 RepID=K2KIL5_HELPX|nr:hypothetical protein OUI_0056 [Helicobacter pylori R036d]
MKDLREDFSASLYADWKDKINVFSHRERAKASKERELDGWAYLLMMKTLTMNWIAWQTLKNKNLKRI